MKSYLDLLETILDKGEFKEDRTGVGTVSLFGLSARYSLESSFPLLTTKEVNFKAIVRELLWFLRGETNTKTLGSKIWDDWADEDGYLGPIYGAQWRSWKAYADDSCLSYDQIQMVLDQICSNPDSRRLVVSAWNVADLSNMALVPCHAFFQFYVRKKKYLDCQLYQRSADMAVGVPFNIASYSLLTIMVAQECGLLPGEFVHTMGDAHIYLNHIDAVKEQLKRMPYPCPQVRVAQKPFFEIQESDIFLENYRCHPRIKLPIAV